MTLNIVIEIRGLGPSLHRWLKRYVFVGCSFRLVKLGGGVVLGCLRGGSFGFGWLSVPAFSVARA